MATVPQSCEATCVPGHGELEQAGQRFTVAMLAALRVTRALLCIGTSRAVPPKRLEEGRLRCLPCHL